MTLTYYYIVRLRKRFVYFCCWDFNTFQLVSRERLKFNEFKEIRDILCNVALKESVWINLDEGIGCGVCLNTVNNGFTGSKHIFQDFVQKKLKYEKIRKGFLGDNSGKDLPGNVK